MIEHLFMLTCGWVGGVVSALLIRHAISLSERDGRRPLDPALLPSPAIPLPTSRGKNAPSSGARPDLSPYAPKPKRSWQQAPQQERITRWVVSKPPVAPPQPPPPPKPPAPMPPPRATDLLPSIAWGQPHGGEGQTLTQEAFKTGLSTAENGHGARAPRRRV